MKFGFVLPNYGHSVSAEQLLEISEACEGAGYDSVWATDHVIMPTELKEPYGELIEPLITLASIGARTSKLRLGTSVIVLPQRNPVLVAKQATALDVFTGGRVILGLGAGWARQEFENLGADFAHRGRVFDEGVRLIRTLWSDETVDFRGRYLRVKSSTFLPKPVRGSIPIWIGGASEAARSRAARLGDGWHAVGLGVDEFRSGAATARPSGRPFTLSLRLNVDVRRRREETTSQSGERRVVLSGGADAMTKALSDYQAAGLDYLCVSILHSDYREIIRDVEGFSREVMGSFR